MAKRNQYDAVARRRRRDSLQLRWQCPEFEIEE